MNNQKLSLFYKSKPLFGFDLGHGSIKIVQLDYSGKKPRLQGYGTTSFDSKAINEGVIADFDIVSNAARSLINEGLKGSIGTHRIAASLPVLHSFSRIINLPIMNDKDVHEAVRTEAGQYIPVPLNDLYLDYQLVEKTPEGQDFLVAAAPKKVVDSYLELFNRLGLELVCLEPSILSVTRVVQHAQKYDIPTLVIDCGSITTDLIIYNKSTVRVTGTIKFGGEELTKSLMTKLNLSYEEAAKMKRTYGVDPGEKQPEMVSALAPNLQFLAAEIKKISRYYEERDKNRNVKVEQVVILGGGANLPGLSTYMTSELRVPTKLADIWQNIDVSHIQKPSTAVATMYSTAAGLASIKPQEAAK
jgi:type IV pilus assembly protein PilM